MNWMYLIVALMILVPVVICLVQHFMEVVSLGLGALGLLLLFAGYVGAALATVALALLCGKLEPYTRKTEDHSFT